MFPHCRYTFSSAGSGAVSYPHFHGPPPLKPWPQLHGRMHGPAAGSMAGHPSVLISSASRPEAGTAAVPCCQSLWLATHQCWYLLPGRPEATICVSNSSSRTNPLLHP
ncbi:hypothetical protein GDO78_019408 [Eleutherodactylus coqui]|uniref:Uncharacterized protein n=1 Tax=Eleutherodactylus coqui TaxID=57060 RepID=A0A8J6JY47_ELECQ|nr:hypothetical protein GDO78_019408 [Eleutherodactylus coqui]